MAGRKSCDAILRRMQFIWRWAKAEGGLHGSILDSEECAILAEWMADTIEFLKEQEPVKPYTTGHGTGFESATSWWYACGNCRESIDHKDKFCRHCGRAVKWDD